VLIIGVLLAHKRYTIQKYFFVLMIVVGVCVFVYNEKDSKKGAESNSYVGLVLIGISLLADGVLGAIEDRMRAATRPSALNFMFSLNLYGAVLLAVVSVAYGETRGFFEFVLKYPDVLWKIGSSALVGSCGQIFIFMMVSEFGPLPCSIVTTTRKLFTVLISVIFMGNPLSGRQQIATVIVFAALFADAFLGKKQLCGKPEELVVVDEVNVELNDSAGKKIPVELETLNEKKPAL
jgi:solute carrier family 35 (UDP-galactose transporter), member B1